MIKFDGINDVVNNITHCANAIVSSADSYYEQLLINLLQQISTCVTMMFTLSNVTTSRGY